MSGAGSQIRGVADCRMLWIVTCHLTPLRGASESVICTCLSFTLSCISLCVLCTASWPSPEGLPPPPAAAAPPAPAPPGLALLSMRALSLMDETPTSALDPSVVGAAAWRDSERERRVGVGTRLPVQMPRCIVSVRLYLVRVGGVNGDFKEVGRARGERERVRGREEEEW